MVTVQRAGAKGTGQMAWRQALKSAGVKGLIWVGEPEYLAKLIQAIGFEKL